MEKKRNSNSTRVVRMNDATRKTGLCTSTIYDLISRGIFPRPFQLVPGGRAVGWLEDDLDNWILNRKANLVQEQP
jgi:prophage regulatory protein